MRTTPVPSIEDDCKAQFSSEKIVRCLLVAPVEGFGTIIRNRSLPYTKYFFIVGQCSQTQPRYQRRENELLVSRNALFAVAAWTIEDSL
jgi:hypothetical protein